MSTVVKPLSDVTREPRALVTGGAAGIGRAIVERFLQQGASVAVLDRNIDGLALGERPTRKPLVIAGDVRSEADVQRAVGATVEAFGGIDVLVNNAGIEGVPGSVVDQTRDQWDELILVNLTSVFLMSKHAVPHILAAGGGAIVNVVSFLAVMADERFAAYAAAKAGVLGLTRQMAVDYGPHGVRVNAVCPSSVDTPMLRREAGWGDDVEANLKRWAQAPLLRRLATPEEVAGPVCFLASDDASYITGVTLMIDGGLSASQRIGGPGGSASP